MKKIKVGIIGCGAIAESFHIPILFAMPEVEIRSISDININRAKNIASRYNIPNYYKDYNKILEDTDISTIYICTPPNLHAEMIVNSLNAGKNVFCEKPLCLSVKDSEWIAETYAKSNNLLMIGHSLRFLENQKTAKKLIPNIIKEPLSIHGQLILGGPFYSWKTASDYYKDPTKGGDILFNNGIHLIDLFQFYFGEICEVSATVRCSGLNKTDEVIDNASLVIKFKNGLIGSMDLAYSGTIQEAFVSIIGTGGKMKIDILKPKIIVYKKGRDISKIKGPYIMSFKQYRSHILLEDEYFIKCILEGKKPTTITLDEARKAVEVVIAAYSSSKEKKVIELPL
ncbi:MAG: Gfo/Idh/MocA family protein [Candidatus Helarchaeota archaeon]